MKGTEVGLHLLLVLSVVHTKELQLGDLPDEVIEHFKNFGLLNSLNIDKNSIEIVPAVSDQRLESQTVTTVQPAKIITPNRGSTLPPHNSDVTSPIPYIDEVTIHPPLNSYVKSGLIPFAQVPEKIHHQETYPVPNQLILPEPEVPVTITRPVSVPVERPVYIRLIQPVQVPIPQPYPVEVRVPTPVYVRVSDSYPIGFQNSFEFASGNNGPSVYQVAPLKNSNGLLNSYVASRLGGVYGNSLNQYQSIGYHKTWL